MRTGALFLRRQAPFQQFPIMGWGRGVWFCRKVRALSPASDLLLVQGRFAPSERDGWETGKVTLSRDHHVYPLHMNLSWTTKYFPLNRNNALEPGHHVSCTERRRGGRGAFPAALQLVGHPVCPPQPPWDQPPTRESHFQEGPWFEPPIKKIHNRHSEVPAWQRGAEGSRGEAAHFRTSVSSQYSGPGGPNGTHLMTPTGDCNHCTRTTYCENTHTARDINMEKHTQARDLNVKMHTQHVTSVWKHTHKPSDLNMKTHTQARDLNMKMHTQHMISLTQARDLDMKTHTQAQDFNMKMLTQAWNLNMKTHTTHNLNVKTRTQHVTSIWNCSHKHMTSMWKHTHKHRTSIWKCTTARDINVKTRTQARDLNVKTHTQARDFNKKTHTARDINVKTHTQAQDLNVKTCTQTRDLNVKTHT